MKEHTDLKSHLSRLDGKSYKAYKDIKDAYHYPDFTLYIDHVQGDPFADPSRVHVRVNQDVAGFPADTYASPSREVALRDYLTRAFHTSCGKFAKGSRGSGKGGIITIDRPGQEILERTSAFVNDSFVEARFVMGLPAFGRRIAGSHAIEMFFDELPRIVEESLMFKNLDKDKLYHHVKTSEDADALRNSLPEKKLVGFVANGAVLPRRSGIDDRPMKGDHVIRFTAPDSLRESFQLPNSGEISGMGISEGVTLIVGGGYHGKSTVLNALERGVYNHLPGDGREYVVAHPEAVKIRAEDGRRIEKTCITPFISNLPFGQNTDTFSSQDGSGSTSQAANIMEALEAGTSVLFIDEDTSATNFMIRDHRMQELVARESEPITPFIDKVRLLYRDHGVSTILVIGGSGDYFDVADTVIMMKEYLPSNVTEEARAIAEKYRAERVAEGGESFGSLVDRVPLAESIDPSKGKRDVKISPKGLQSIMFGTTTIQLGAVEQLVHTSQTRAIADAIYYARQKYMDGKRTLREVLDGVMADLHEKGLDILHPGLQGDYALFRKLELAAAINRMRTLKMSQKK